MQVTWVWSLGWEEPLEKEMATHTSILAWKIPWTEECRRLQSMGLQRVGHDWVTNIHTQSRSHHPYISDHHWCYHTGRSSKLQYGLVEYRNRCSSIFHLFSSVQFSHSVMFDSLWPHESQHARPPCPSPTPGVHSNSCPSSRWCHPAISSSVIPFFSCLQSFPASGSFPVSQLFTSGGQSIGVSASTSVLSMNTQDWSPLGWTGWISLQSKGLSRIFSNTTVQKHQFFGAQLSSQSNFHIHTWPLEKP